MTVSPARQFAGMFVAAVLAVGILIPTGAIAGDRFEVDLHAIAASPQGKFGDAIKTTPAGFSIQGFYRLLNLPVKVGVDFGYLHYGYEHRDAPFSDAIPDVTVRVNRHNQMIRFGAVLRFQRDYGKVSPYVDGYTGVNYLWTSTGISGRDNSYVESIISTNLDDTAAYGGVGGGIAWELFRAKNDQCRVLIDCGARYLAGGEASYLTKGAVKVGNDGSVTYNKSTSKTSIVDYRIGMAVRF